MSHNQGYICMIILKTFFLDLMESRLLDIWKNLSAPDENVGKRTELFDISSIVYGQGNVLKTIKGQKMYSMAMQRVCLASSRK